MTAFTRCAVCTNTEYEANCYKPLLLHLSVWWILCRLFIRKCRCSSEFTAFAQNLLSPLAGSWPCTESRRTRLVESTGLNRDGYLGVGVKRPHVPEYSWNVQYLYLVDGNIRLVIYLLIARRIVVLSYVGD